jgi:hypothetical protein
MSDHAAGRRLRVPSLFWGTTTYEHERCPVRGMRPLPKADADFRDKAISLRRFGEYMREANARHVLAIFDSCFAGTVFNTARSMPPPAITLATTQPVREFISSGEADQEVSDDGTFRKLFLDVLAGKEPDADANHDGYVTGTELGLFLHQKMTNLSYNRQTPRYGKLNAYGYDRGDFVFQVGKPDVSSIALVPKPQPINEAAQAWAAAQGTTSQAVLEDYIKRYGGSFYGTLARDRLEEMKKSQVAVVAPPPQTTSATSKEQATQQPPAVTSNQEAPATIVRAPNGTTVSFPSNATVAVISDAMAMQFGTGTLESVATGGYQWRLKTAPSPPSTTKPAQATLGTAEPSAMDVIANRGNWDGSTASPHPQLKTASIISTPRPGASGQATSDPKTIASGGPWASVPYVAKSSEGAVLAYAADESGYQKTVVARAAPSINPTTALPKSPLPAPSIALQQTAAQLSSTTQQSNPPSSSVLEAIPINDLPLPPAGPIAVKTIPVKDTPAPNASLPERPASVVSGKDGTAAEAKALLYRAVSELKVSETAALDKFNKPDGGFRDRDLYVFCINVTDGRFTAHANPAMLGHDIKTITEKYGSPLGEKVYAAMKEGTISIVDYNFPRVGGTEPVPKQMFVTKVGNQGCGIGYYKG